MRLTCYAAVLVLVAPFVAVGCGGAEDPLGGPYGGTENTVAPNMGNVGSVTAEADADVVEDTGPSSSSGGRPSSSGSSGGSSTSSSGGKTSSGSTSGSTRDSGTGSSSGATSGSSSGATSGSSSGATSGSSSGATSGSSSGGTTTAPTFTMIFTEYLKSGTIGNCTGCHRQMSSASGSYSWLSGQGYIRGTGSILVKTGSCLTWYGGTMPPGGTRSNAMATADMNAWAAAGAMNN